MRSVLRFLTCKAERCRDEVVLCYATLRQRADVTPLHRVSVCLAKLIRQRQTAMCSVRVSRQAYKHRARLGISGESSADYTTCCERCRERSNIRPMSFSRLTCFIYLFIYSREESLLRRIAKKTRKGYENTISSLFLFPDVTRTEKGRWLTKITVIFGPDHTFRLFQHESDSSYMYIRSLSPTSWWNLIKKEFFSHRNS